MIKTVTVDLDIWITRNRGWKAGKAREIGWEETKEKDEDQVNSQGHFVKEVSTWIMS